MSQCVSVGCEFYAPADGSSKYCSAHEAGTEVAHPAPPRGEEEAEGDAVASAGEDDGGGRTLPAGGSLCQPPLKRARTSDESEGSLASAAQEGDDVHAMPHTEFVRFCGALLRRKMESKGDVEAAVSGVHLTADQARILILAMTSRVSYVMHDRDTTILHTGDECGDIAHPILKRIVPLERANLESSWGAEGYHAPQS